MGHSRKEGNKGAAGCEEPALDHPKIGGSGGMLRVGGGEGQGVGRGWVLEPWTFEMEIDRSGKAWRYLHIILAVTCRHTL